MTTTRNVTGNWQVQWFRGGLGYQVDHHLFPMIPRHKLGQLMYQTVPYWPLHYLFSLRHSARIVVLLHLVRGADGMHRIQRQEDLLQVDSILSAFFPHFLSLPLVHATRMLMRLSALFILAFLVPALSIVRLLFGW